MVLAGRITSGHLDHPVVVARETNIVIVLENRSVVVAL